jgi:serine/threonine protein kinase
VHAAWRGASGEVGGGGGSGGGGVAAAPRASFPSLARSFSPAAQVVAATDTRTGSKVAVKVIKNKDAFRRQARTEIRLLELLNKKDPDDQWCIVRFLEQFDHGGHTCLVFEHLSFNLYECVVARRGATRHEPPPSRPTAPHPPPPLLAGC